MCTPDRHVTTMDARLVAFGQLEVDGRRYDHDVVIENGRIRRRDKGPSKALPGGHRFGHTPLSAAEAIPWSGRRLIVGTGAYGRLPIMPELYEEARRRGVEVVAMSTADACRLLSEPGATDNPAILHVTC